MPDSTPDEPCAPASPLALTGRCQHCGLSLVRGFSPNPARIPGVWVHKGTGISICHMVTFAEAETVDSGGSGS